jgi:hypothetical protein
VRGIAIESQRTLRTLFLRERWLTTIDRRYRSMSISVRHLSKSSSVDVVIVRRLRHGMAPRRRFLRRSRGYNVSAQWNNAV